MCTGGGQVLIESITSWNTSPIGLSIPLVAVTCHGAAADCFMTGRSRMLTLRGSCCCCCCWWKEPPTPFATSRLGFTGFCAAAAYQPWLLGSSCRPPEPAGHEKLKEDMPVEEGRGTSRLCHAEFEPLASWLQLYARSTCLQHCCQQCHG